MIGVSWSSQLVAFLICFAFGILGSFVCLLFFRKARPLERALTDLVSVLVLISLFLLSIELGCDGKIKIYSIIAFLLALPVIPKGYKYLTEKLDLNKIKFKKKPK